MHARVLAALVGVLAVLTATALPAAAAVPVPPTYLPPLGGPITEPFDPPTTPYGPGHRGISYEPAPGTQVRAVGDGVVAFAGAVAGSLHVTIRHPDGIRTTSSYLASIAVVIGQHVHQGDVVGVAGARFQLGARRGDDYFDPASLFAGTATTAHLVPFDEPPGEGPAGERSAIGQLLRGVRDVVGAVGDAAGWLRGDPTLLLRTAAQYNARFLPGLGALTNGAALLGAWQDARRRSDRPCTAPDSPLPPPPAARRVVVEVAGLGSNSRSATVEHVDTAALGYDAPDVLRFSYAGGRTPDPSDGFPDIPTTDYEAPDTQTDLRATAARLADLVEAVAADAPGVPIDLLAHSQGGVVVRLALIELDRRHGTAWLGRLGLVTTIASPHGGADLATAVYALSTTSTGDALIDGYQSATHLDLSDEGTSLAQLSEGSDVVRELADHPIPPAVHALALAARGDWVVPVPRAHAAGATNVVLPATGGNAHSDVVGSPGAQREIALALAALPPGCESFPDALLDGLSGEAISYGEDLVGAAGWASGWWLDVRSR
jgi:hypothetical protein